MSARLLGIVVAGAAAALLRRAAKRNVAELQAADHTRARGQNGWGLHDEVADGVPDGPFIDDAAGTASEPAGYRMWLVSLILLLGSSLILLRLVRSRQ